MGVKMNSNTRTLLMIVALLGQLPPPLVIAAQSTSPAQSNQSNQWQTTPGPLSDPGLRATLDLAQSQTSQNPPAQDQPIRLKTELIDLRAVVTNKRGQPITDLKKEDFELLENGKPQEVSFFSIVKIPGRGEARRSENPPAAAAPNVPAGVTRAPETPARTVLLFVDTLHLSPQSLLNVKQSLRKFIDERLTDHDLTAIVTSAGSRGPSPFLCH